MSPLSADTSMSLHLKKTSAVRTTVNVKVLHEGQLWRSTHLNRFGAQTSARFRACMFVWVLNVARWAKCLVRYSRVLNTVKKVVVTWIYVIIYETGPSAPCGRVKGSRSVVENT